MLFEKEKNPPYTTKGVGELKLLKNSETGKSRILVRADGGLRVLLNSGIQGNFQYETISDGLVRFPVINSDQKLDTFVIKVKTKDDGEQLVAKLNELKN
ncbi:PH domain-like protein [Yamadazyma tenuis ATCC 10573]|uniref:PH domain-like protein n=2 Tax=Candida tenuis TaxID=2315449 RepID=G3B3Y7_CANTC|nr:PH domain-like protein [Yamadazyma tenuis ATCC 10573]EGV63892.1 PH domain-like protein [Yamadazyma tenuis ATCC 10573]